ncbi:MAG: serine protease [Spirochaetales bacterium]|nr:serine protease [Spirochaetales bacterium]
MTKKKKSADHYSITGMFIVFIPLVFFLFSCASQPEEKPGEKDLIPEETFQADGYTYTGHPADNQLIRHLNKYKTDYPETSQQLLDNFAKKQRWLIGRYIENNDFYGARFHFNNLYAVSFVDKMEEERFNKELLYLAYRNNLFASEKYLRISNTENLSNTKFTPLADVNDYSFLLAEIFVDRTYEARNKLHRRDHPEAMGSGILIDEQLILTAYHVIEHVFYENTVEYTIRLNLQGRTVDKVEVLAWDSLTDLAVLKTNESFEMKYPFYSLLGDSNTLKQGFEVYCFGHHEGFTATLTKGIISSPSRRAPETGKWIQVDAAVSPGASGGMLIGQDNLIYGLLVAGVVYEDINFVVPSNIILSEIDRLMAGKNTIRPWLGTILKEDKEKREVRIKYIFPSSPLREIDVHMEDILVSINGIRIDSIEKGQELLGYCETGNIVNLFFLKPDKTPVQYYVVLARRPDYALYNATRMSDSIGSLFPYFGIALDNKKMVKKSMILNEAKVEVPFYHVIKVEKEIYFDNMGVKPGDSIGIIFDGYENLTRYIQVIHLPEKISLASIKNIADYIYTVKRNKYDENIL